MLEIIAYVTMVLDHIGKVLLNDSLLLRGIGRISLPLFTYFIVRGVNFTTNYNKYCARLLAVAIISQPIYMKLFDINCLNICFTLLLCALILKTITASGLSFIKKCIILQGILIIMVAIEFEYELYALLLALTFGLLNEKVVWILLHCTVTILFIYIFQYPPIQILSMIGTILVCIKPYDTWIHANRKYRAKYLIYPLHMLILLLITELLS